jgi:hypothetical protein
MARKPRCLYCGGELAMDDAARASVQQAQAAQAAPAAALIAMAPCPACNRPRKVQVGGMTQCNYCGCLYSLPAEGAATIPGPPGTVFQAAAPGTAEDARVELLEKLNASVAAGGHQPGQLTALALEAVSWRFVHGNLTQEELNELVRLLRDLERYAHGDFPPQQSPLSAEDAGEVIIHSICPRHTASTEVLVDGLVVVRIKTSSHRVGGDPMADSQGFEVNHNLRVDLMPIPGGCVLEFSSQWATGEAQEMDPAQTEIMETIIARLPAHSVRPTLLKAVYGTWMKPMSSLAVRPEALSQRLALLGPGLDGLMALCE